MLDLLPEVGVTARTSGPCYQQGRAFRYKCALHHHEEASRGAIHAVTVRGNPPPVGTFHLLEKMSVFPNRGMKLILIRRSLSPVLLSAGFLLLH